MLFVNSAALLFYLTVLVYNIVVNISFFFVIKEEYRTFIEKKNWHLILLNGVYIVIKLRGMHLKKTSILHTLTEETFYGKTKNSE